MSILLLQPSFLMSKTRSYAKIFLGSRLFLTAMAIHLSLRVAPPDLQQGGNSRISYVHVPAARMSIVIYIATAINSSLFPLTKHPLFLRSSGTGTEIGAFSTLFTLVTGGFRGRPMWVAEILDAYRKRGIARKKRENLHRLASTNRSFAHFRWW